VYYTNDSVNGNTGDSWCSMGRVALFDARAWKLMGDGASVNRDLLVLQNDLIANTWMHESYGCDGKQQQNRTDAYFEYPSTVVMILREVRYGIRLGFQSVEVSPISNQQSFSYNIGNVHVDYNPFGDSSIKVPAVKMTKSGGGKEDSHTKYCFHGFPPSQRYSIKQCKKCHSDGKEDKKATATSDGVLCFSAAAGCRIRVLIDTEIGIIE